MPALFMLEMCVIFYLFYKGTLQRDQLVTKKIHFHFPHEKSDF